MQLNEFGKKFRANEPYGFSSPYIDGDFFPFNFRLAMEDNSIATWWALRPSPEDYQGLIFFKDVGLSGSWWYSDGYTWGPCAPVVLFSRAGLVCPANTALNTVFKELILPDLMGDSRELIFDGLFSFTNNANSKTLRLTAGSYGAPTVIGTTAPTTNAALNFSHKWGNTAKNAQSYFPSLSAPYSITASAVATSAIDTSAPFYIGVNIQLANASDVAQITRLTVTLK